MITQEELHERFTYDSEAGNLINKKKNVIVGTVHPRGYIVVHINYKLYAVHRLVYIYHHGSIPDEYVIDHIDHNKRNNRIENLQAIKGSENSRKKKIIRSGYKNVSPSLKHEGKWEVRLTLGPFDTPEEAYKRYQKISSWKNF
jgi:hypothetical protein